MTEENELLDAACRSRRIEPRWEAAAAEPSWWALRAIQFQAGVRDWADGFRASPSATRPFPRMIGGVLDSRDVNAQVFAHLDVFFVLVNSGAFAACEEVFLRLLCDPGVLPWVGDAAGEDAARAFPPIAASVKGRGRVYTGASAEDLPRDPVRTLAALWLARAALDFVTFHEVRHVVAGHVGYNERYGLGVLAEVGGPPVAPEFALARQAMEMDADAIGVSGVLRTHLDGWADRSESGPGWHKICPEKGQLIEALLLSLDVVLLLIGSPSGPAAEWGFDQHPPWVVRRFNAVGTAEEYLKRRGHQDVARIPGDRGRIQRSFRTVNKIQNEFFGWDVVLDETDKFRSDEGAAHTEKIFEAWKAIEPELSKSSYVSFAGLRAG